MTNQIEKVAQSESEERSFFKQSPAILCIIGQDGYFKKVNPAWEKLLGWSCLELMQRPWIEFVHPDDVASSLTAQRQCQDKDDVRFLNRYRHQDGSYRWLSWTISPYRQGLAYAVASDITELQRELASSRQEQEALRRSETIYRTLLENASDCVCHIGLDGRFIYMNKGGVTLNELASAAEVCGQDCTASIKAEYKQQMHAALDRARQGEPSKIEYASINAKGRELWWESVVNAIKDDNGNVVGLLRSSRNINEQKQKTQALKEAKEAADSANRAKSEFLANMSHELRTPLNGILGYTQILQRDRELTTKQQEGLSIIHQCASHLLTLIDDILDLSKIEARKMELYKRDFHFPSFLQGVVEICRIKAEQKGISFAYQPAGDLPVGIQADEKRLRQVLINLLSNAIKFTQKGGVTFKVSVIGCRGGFNPDICPTTSQFDKPARTPVVGAGLTQISAFPQVNSINPPVQRRGGFNPDMCPTTSQFDKPARTVVSGEDNGQLTTDNGQLTTDKIRFQVADTGVGITQAQIDKIFLPFEQVGDRQKQAEGTGLGLAISQKIVQLMGSSIQVKSQPSQGSVFWFDVDLPASTDWVQAARVVTQGKIIGIKGRKRKILVVDDRWENRSVLVNILEAIGFEMAEAVNGQEALEKACQLQPDLIVSDLVMPVMDGFEMMRQLRLSPQLKDVVVIVSSASVFEADQHKSWTAGASDFLPKPVQADDLLQKLQKHLQLEWVYEEKDEFERKKDENISPPTSDFTLETSIVAPPEQEMEALFKLAKRGNLKGIIAQAEKLEHLDEKFVPFATQLRQLAQGCQVNKIKEFISFHRGAEQ